MRTLRAETVDTILHDLRHASSWQTRIDQTTGGVYCLERNRECIPFTLGKRTFFLEFQTPYFLTQVELYSEMLFKTKSGGYFVPKLEFRYLNTTYLTDDCVISQVCEMPASELTREHNALADAMRNALIVYYRSYPGANQYFYMFEANTKGLLHKGVHGHSCSLAGAILL